MRRLWIWIGCAILLAVAAIVVVSWPSQSAPTTPPSAASPRQPAPGTDGPSDMPLDAAGNPTFGTSFAEQERFVRYWFDELQRANKAGDTRELERISHPECEVCEKYIQGARMALTDTVFHDGTFDLSNVRPNSEFRNDRILSMDLETPESTVSRRDGSIRLHETPERIDLVVSITPDDTSWLLREMMALKAEPR